MIFKKIFIGSFLLSLAGCNVVTLDQLKTDLAEATTISCSLSNGAQAVYTIGTQVIQEQDIKSKNFIQASSKIASGTDALCKTLTKVNAQISTIPSVPAESAQLFPSVGPKIGE